MRDGDEGEVGHRPELREPRRRERGRCGERDLFLERGQVRGRGVGIGVGGRGRGLHRGGCVRGFGRGVVVGLEVAPGIVLGVAAAPVVHHSLTALGAGIGLGGEGCRIVPLLLVMRERHLVGIARRLDARLEREDVQDQERQVVEAQAEEVDPTLLRGHLGDVRRVRQVEPPHGDDLRRGPRCVRTKVKSQTTARSFQIRRTDVPLGPDGVSETRSMPTSEARRIVTPTRHSANRRSRDAASEARVTVVSRAPLRLSKSHRGVRPTCQRTIGILSERWTRRPPAAT